MPQATRLDIFADQPCREEHDPYAGNRRIAQRLGVIGAQRAGDRYLLEGIACLGLATKEPTIGRLQRIDKSILLQQVGRLGDRRLAVQIGRTRAGNAPVRCELAGEHAGIDERTDADRQVGADGQQIDSHVGQ
ncbi:MAG: hypothetical protein JWP51_1157 [Bradyrhizobium sp.]|nr:hypothetical protein [Bradyrhizobium sp.]